MEYDPWTVIFGLSMEYDIWTVIFGLSMEYDIWTILDIISDYHSGLLYDHIFQLYPKLWQHINNVHNLVAF